MRALEKLSHYFKGNKLLPAPSAGQGKWDQFPHKPSQNILASLTAPASRGQMLDIRKKPVKNLVDSLSNMDIFDPTKCILQGIFSLNWK